MLNHRIEGAGSPLLLIHGFGISFNIWGNLLPSLKKYFRVILIELPGIGASPAPQGDYLAYCVQEIEQLRAALKIERWCIFSYSSGTRVAEAYLEAYADRVGRVVYLCPIQMRLHGSIGLRLAKALDSRFPQIGNWVLSGRRLNFLIRLLGFNLQRSKYAQSWMEEISSGTIGILKQTLRSLPLHGGKPFATPPVPYLFIWGKNDLITASPRKPNAHDRLINADHSAPMTAADEIAELVIPFLSATG
jgi:pimeloyl-ACP methyl ester carboxylesterase